MVTVVTRIKYVETAVLSYIVMTPYFYFIILRLMCSYIEFFESLNSLGQMVFKFSFLCQN